MKTASRNICTFFSLLSAFRNLVSGGSGFLQISQTTAISICVTKQHAASSGAQAHQHYRVLKTHRTVEEVQIVRRRNFPFHFFSTGRVEMQMGWHYCLVYRHPDNLFGLFLSFSHAYGSMSRILLSSLHLLQNCRSSLGCPGMLPIIA